ncbi:MAG: TraB/GumN family protein, partial [Planctomycetota bacterium]
MLKNRLYRLIPFFIFVLMCFQVNAHAADNPFLWKIEGARLSYLFGTIHFPDPRVTTLPDSVETAFRNSQVVYTEIPLDRATMVAQVSKLMLPGDQTLLDIVPPELISRTEKYMKGVNPALTIEPFTKFKVWALALSLSSLEQQVNNPGKLALDAQLYQRAQQQGKKVAGLETVEEQITIFDNLNQKEQIKMLRDTLDFIDGAKEKGINIPEQFITWYTKGDIDAFGNLLMQYVKKDGFYDAFLQKVLYKRNQLMAERIVKIIQTNPDKSHFFAIGAGHFWGKSAIQNYLAKQGLEITRMGTNKNPHVAEDNVAMVTEENQKETQIWYDKGILYTVYGNDKAAIPYFQKVIDRDPRRSDAY